MTGLLIAFAVGLLITYLPGFLLFRAIRFSNLVALVCAPLASGALYGLLPIFYDFAGIPCDLITMGVCPLLVCAVLAVLAYKSSKMQAAPAFQLYAPRGRLTPRRTLRESGVDWSILAVYVICGIVLCRFLFISSLGAPDAFFSRFDNQTHLNLAQSFIDSGVWSSLHPSRYGGGPEFANAYVVSGGFYPATWHAMVALISLASGAAVTVSSNALTAVCAAVVFPAGMFMLIRTIFPENRGAQLAGALICVSFATYPWVFPIKGPTLPNMLGFALMIPFMAAFITFFKAGRVRELIVPFVLFSFISFISMTISHTNALFTAFVFLAAYGGHYLKRFVDRSPRFASRNKRNATIGIVCGYTLLILAFWAFCLKVPVLAGVVGYTHIESNSLLQALRELFFLRLTINGNQYAIVVACLVGVYLCLKERIWWILIPPAYMAIAYVLSRIGLQPWLTIFVGLWYSLPYRVGACLCIYLMPIASLGFARIIEAACSLVKRLVGSGEGAKAFIPAIAGALVVVVFVALTFPKYPVNVGPVTYNSPFSVTADKLRYIYGQDANRVYGAEEVAFVEQVKQVIPENALVINQPNDGSVFAYGVNHLNTYYRGTSGKNLKKEARVIRKKLNQYAQNEEVRDAVASTGAEYLLMLDNGVKYEDQIVLPQYTKALTKRWTGVDKIDDNTPGFTVVLSEGDMRLYHIG